MLLVAASCGGDGVEVGGAGPVTISIEAVDTPAFHPDLVSVSVGESIRFVVTNAGQGLHEFVVADEETQAGLAESGDHGEHAAEALASLSLEPGEAEEVTLTFEEPGELLYACHVDGHYEAGMVGTLVVE